MTLATSSNMRLLISTLNQNQIMLFPPLPSRCHSTTITSQSDLETMPTIPPLFSPCPVPLIRPLTGGTKLGLSPHFTHTYFFLCSLGLLFAGHSLPSTHTWLKLQKHTRSSLSAFITASPSPHLPCLTFQAEKV